MTGGQQYFIWNLERAFSRGSSKNMVISEQGITLQDMKEKGVYYTNLCDSGEEETEWERLVISAHAVFPEEIRISVFSSDTPDIFVRDTYVSIEEVLASDSVSIKEKDMLFQNRKQKETKLYEYILLHGIRGRFLWLRIQLESIRNDRPYIQEMQLFFPKISWMSFLPEVYQTGNSFLERYLDIFQTMYQEMDDRIERLPEWYAVDSVPKERLIWLSQWLGVEDPYLWQEWQLRYLIRHSMELAEIRGTVDYLKRMICLYIGTVPYIVEYWQWAYEEMSSARRNRMEELYGRDSFCVTVVLEEQEFTDEKTLSALKRLITQSSPAHIDARLEILQPYIFLDQHSYLGLNSRLETWGNACLDGQRFLPFVVLKEKENHYEGQ